MLNMKGRWVDDCNWLRTEAISADNRSLSFSKNVCSSSGIFVTVVDVVVVAGELRSGEVGELGEGD